MGWGSGTEIAETMVDLCVNFVPLHFQKAFLKHAFGSLIADDWDTTHDMFGGDRPIDKLAEEVLRELNPDWYSDEKEWS